MQLAVSHNEYLINGQTAGHGTNKLKQIKQKIRKYKEDEWRTGLSFWLSQRLRHLSLAAGYTTTTQEWIRAGVIMKTMMEMESPLRQKKMSITD